MWKVPAVFIGIDLASGSDRTMVTTSLGGCAEYPKRGERLVHIGNDLRTMDWRAAKRTVRRGGALTVDLKRDNPPVSGVTKTSL